MYKCIIIFFLFPLIGYSQLQLQKIEVATKFADGGDYEPSNKNIIYVAISEEINPHTMEGISLRLKNFKTNTDSVIVPNIYLSDPYYGWLDESNLYFEKNVTENKTKLFGPSQSQLVKYNIYTQTETILPFNLLNSENFTRMLKIASNKIYYLSIGDDPNENALYEYNLADRKTKIIKSFNRYGTQQIVTYEILSDLNSMIYILKKEDKTSFIKIDLKTLKETEIKSIARESFIDGSSYFGQFFYYFERRKLSNKVDVNDNTAYVLNSLNTENGEIKCIKKFDTGTEITKIDMVSSNEMVISMQGGAINPININITKDIQIELSSNSNLYYLKF